jgi:hypothetical protein
VLCFDVRSMRLKFKEMGVEGGGGADVRATTRSKRYTYLRSRR